MSKEQLSVTELLLSLDSSELQEAEQVRATVNQQLSSDRGGAVLSSVVDHYLESSSSQAVLLLSSVREPHHKLLLDKLHECVSRPGTRLPALTLLGHLIRKQPPWVHHVSRSALLQTLLRCLKTDTDVVVLITAVLVLITLLPMIPQAGKQHIYDFFDVFGRLASWSYRNPGHVAVVHLVHLHAGVYSLFHRLYGMFPCNFISYLRLHYSMKENLDTFQEIVKPMLEHVRVHPELVTGTQDQELDPSRWRCYEVHDIVIECSRVSLDPLESSCEEDVYSPPPSPCSPHHTDSSAGSSGAPSLFGPATWPQLTFDTCPQADDVTWSPSSHCGLSTPPPEPSGTGSAHSLSRTTSISGVKCPPPASVPPTLLSEDNQVKQQPTTELGRSSIQPITEKVEKGQGDVTDENSEEVRCRGSPLLLTSTPSSSSLPPPPPSVCFTPTIASTRRSREGGPAPSYEPLFELALPHAATLFIGRKTQEVLDRAANQLEMGEGGRGGLEGEDREQDQTSVSPLEVLDQLIVHGHDAHESLNRRLSAGNRSVERSHFGGKQQSMKTKGLAGGEELQSLKSQLLLIHGQLQYERFKRQQHAIRNRRLLRRVINATVLEEHCVAMKAQLGVQDEEIRSLKSSLEEEQRRYTQLQQDTHEHTHHLHTNVQQLLLRQQDEQRDHQRLQNELQECHSSLRAQEAELQKANYEACNAEHQLTQLSLKVSSSEQLQQQIFLLNQQLVLLRETNRALTNQLEGEGRHWTEASMLQCSVGKEYQRLRDSEVQQRQKLEAANHRTVEMENQLSKKDQLILDQKKLLEDTKAQSRAELSACDSRCVALRTLAQNLQTEMLQLYSQIQVDTHSRPNGSMALPVARPSSSSSVGIINGGVGALSTSPLHLPSCSSSPLESPLAAVGSFLEQRARQLFRPAIHSPEEEEEEEEDPQEEDPQEEEVVPQPEDPALVQEAAPSLPAADLTLAVRQRRHELSIMDYDETLPEY